MADNNNTVDVTGMFGNGKTYFNDSPVVVDISGLVWSDDSPFNIVRINVFDSYSKVIGDFHADTGGQTEISFDIQSALRALWADYDFAKEVAAANAALTATTVDGQSFTRKYRGYYLELFTEYLDSKDHNFDTSQSKIFKGGQCMIGKLTEWERYNIDKKEDADASHWEHTNLRNGDASTKPTQSPERVGLNSITSWVDVSTNGTTSVFFHPKAQVQADSYNQHAPIVLRDNQDYQDFLFVNRRGAVETASAIVKDALNIDIDVDQYNKIERPTFKPSRSLLTVASGGRRSWDMSSGYVDRYWAEWWTQDFLHGKRHWMLLDGRYVPVIITPSKKSISIYDRTKQTMVHVDFTVTLALEG